MPEVLRACWAMEMMPERRGELEEEEMCADRLDWDEMERGWGGGEL